MYISYISTHKYNSRVHCTFLALVVYLDAEFPCRGDDPGRARLRQHQHAAGVVGPAELVQHDHAELVLVDGAAVVLVELHEQPPGVGVVLAAAPEEVQAMRELLQTPTQRETQREIQRE